MKELLRPTSLSIFFPAYNDARSLPHLMDETFCVVSMLTDDFEVIVVNDGSYDNTAEVLGELEHKYHPALRVIHHHSNQGYGAALRSGMAASQKEWIFYTDGDGQYDVAQLAGLWQQATGSVDWVNGFKLCRSDAWYRRAIGALYNQAVRFLFRIKLRDIDCDFRLMRRTALAGMDFHSTSGTICVELVRKLEQRGYRAVEVGVDHLPRRHGRSQFFRLRPLLRTALQLFRLYRTTVPAPAPSRSGR